MLQRCIRLRCRHRVTKEGQRQTSIHLDKWSSAFSNNTKYLALDSINPCTKDATGSSDVGSNAQAGTAHRRQLETNSVAFLQHFPFFDKVCYPVSIARCVRLVTTGLDQTKMILLLRCTHANHFAIEHPWKQFLDNGFHSSKTSVRHKLLRQ